MSSNAADDATKNANNATSDQEEKKKPSLISAGERDRAASAANNNQEGGDRERPHRQRIINFNQKVRIQLLLTQSHMSIWEDTIGDKFVSFPEIVNELTNLSNYS